MVGIIFLCLLQANIPRSASARLHCAAYAATWAITLLSIFGILLDVMPGPSVPFVSLQVPVYSSDLVLFVLWGLMFGIRFLSLTSPRRDRRTSPFLINAGAPEPNPPSLPAEETL